MLEVMLLDEKVGVTSLKLCDRVRLRAKVRNVNEAAKRIETYNITELNFLMNAAAYVTIERVEMLKNRKQGRIEEPF